MYDNQLNPPVLRGSLIDTPQDPNSIKSLVL